MGGIYTNIVLLFSTVLLRGPGHQVISSPGNPSNFAGSFYGPFEYEYSFGIWHSQLPKARDNNNFRTLLTEIQQSVRPVTVV